MRTSSLGNTIIWWRKWVKSTYELPQLPHATYNVFRNSSGLNAAYIRLLMSKVNVICLDLPDPSPNIPNK